MIIKIGKFNFVSENKEEFRLFQDNSYSMFNYFYMDGKEDTLYVHSRDVYIDRLKKGTILDKQKFRELDDINLVRSFEMLMFQIEGEKYREEHQGRNNFQDITTEETEEEDILWKVKNFSTYIKK